ncbi:MAG: DUF305 domain-containing protein [Gemmatimonadales bacterium]|nr:MAG: DUF305 domain-containing protein [Gemmatimonadales bacterium]
MIPSRPHALLRAWPLAAGLLFISSGCAAGPAPGTPVSGSGTPATATTFQPGAPGADGRTVATRPGQALGLLAHTADDVHFMQMMIAHHAQALEMTALVPERSVRDDVAMLARRIQASQADEIELMRRWLEDRGEWAPPVDLATGRLLAGDPHGDHGHAHDHDGHGHHAHHHHHDPDPDHDHGEPDHVMGHDHAGMAGMLTPAQMESLAASTGQEFDRLFLEFMIYHHEGAVQMVHELFASDAGGQEGEIFGFAAHVESDQVIEIERMRQMLARGS